MLSLLPFPASDATRYQLIDVRPAHERHAGQGFIAGALGLPECDGQARAGALQHMAGGRQPVLVCADGHRAKSMAESLAALSDFPLLYLEGGLQGWNDAGLPIAGRRHDTWRTSALAPAQFARELKEQLDQILGEVDPEFHMTADALLLRCALILQRRLDRMEPAELRAVLEILAVDLLELAIPRQTISAMLDRLLSRLPEGDLLTRATAPAA